MKSMTKKTKSEFLADKSVSIESEDRFQRFGFSKRIAETIINRNSEENIVYGIYGAWGEGKTSVLNFIDSEISKNDSFIVVHLNPWKYRDENAMILDLFVKISELFSSKLSAKHKKLGKAFADLITRFGAPLGMLGVSPENVAKIFSNSQIEALKDNVDELLNKSNKRLVIFIDDIDRLDKEEIYSVFKLVKLIANFSNSTYILSFDEKMVAQAIAERYGAGDLKSGENFLEKIIQVPLIIPKAQKEALLNYTYDLLNKILEQNNITISEEESNRFTSIFRRNIFPFLVTPRLAKRYSNILSFSIPMMKGEVNLIDLLIIEAVKVFFPKHIT